MKRTLSIALLVGTTFNTLLPLFTVRIDAFFSYTVFDAAEAGSGVVAFLARLLAISASVFNLSALATGRLRRDHSRREGVHMHGHSRIWKRMNSHRGLEISGLGLILSRIVRIRRGAVRHC